MMVQLFTVGVDQWQFDPLLLLSSRTFFTQKMYSQNNIKFSKEKEEYGRLPFLDVNIFCENDKFATNIYRKKTFSGVYTNFKSFISETYKIGLIESLSFWCFSLSSDFIKFHREIDKLNSIL